MKDWRGTEYTIGSTVVYPASSGSMCEVTEGVVTDIATVYRHPETWRWTRLRGGEALPFQRRWDHAAGGYVETGEPVSHRLRVRIKPLCSSRWPTGRSGDSHVLDDDDGCLARDEHGRPKVLPPADGYREVTVTRVENITVLAP